MNTETERKFLVRKDFWYALKKPSGKPILQGYLFSGKATGRVRIYGDDAFLTIKGPSEGISRPEFEYPIPLEDARFMLENLCGRVIDKVRYRYEYKGKIWDIDEFFGEDEGLILAEIELTTPDEPFEIPSWMGEEVTGDPRYFNSWLAEHPYSSF